MREGGCWSTKYVPVHGNGKTQNIQNSADGDEFEIILTLTKAFNQGSNENGIFDLLLRNNTTLLVGLLYNR